MSNLKWNPLTESTSACYQDHQSSYDFLTWYLKEEKLIWGYIHVLSIQTGVHLTFSTNSSWLSCLHNIFNCLAKYKVHKSISEYISHHLFQNLIQSTSGKPAFIHPWHCWMKQFKKASIYFSRGDLACSSWLQILRHFSIP